MYAEQVFQLCDTSQDLPRLQVVLCNLIAPGISGRPGETLASDQELSFLLQASREDSATDITASIAGVPLLQQCAL